MNHNLELKARCADLQAARQRAEAAGALPSGVEAQRDIYFQVPSGRLKLRCRAVPSTSSPSSTSEAAAVDASEVIEVVDTTGADLQAGARWELIGYQRPDVEGSRQSDYTRLPLSDGEAMLRVLADTVGVRHEVRKCREILLWKDVRIHLDEVEQLGCFIEFEALLDRMSPEAAVQRLAHLREALHITEADVVAGSYVDLMDARDPTNR
jgi:adenylate cyclase class 2